MKQELLDFFIANNVFRQLGLDRIGIFGSYARGEKYKDIDLLLDEDPGYEKREMLKEMVESRMHVPCDVVVKNNLEPIILHYVNKDLVYVKSR
jgi:predicted nucleotidyltransferase